MKTPTLLWLSVVLALGAGVAAAQPPASTSPLRPHTFEDNVSDWVVFGPNARAGITHDAEHVKEGQAALQFTYPVKVGEFSGLVLMTPDGILSRAKSFRCWIQADSATPLVLVLQEREGGRYMATFSVQKDTWQRVEVAPSDFILAEDKSDPKDPDNKLDLDQVEAVAIGDLSQIFAQVQNPDLARLFNVQTGAHNLYLDDFRISEEALPETVKAPEGPVDLDAFQRPQLSWVGLGGVTLTNLADKLPDRHGLRADYHQSPGQLVGLLKRLPRGGLVGMTRLIVEVASGGAATLLVQLEEKGGGKYNTTFVVPADSAQMKKVSIDFADLKPANDSHDANNRLDLDQVQQLLIIDVTGVLGLADTNNTLWISKVQASAGP